MEKRRKAKKISTLCMLKNMLSVQIIANSGLCLARRWISDYGACCQFSLPTPPNCPGLAIQQVEKGYQDG